MNRNENGNETRKLSALEFFSGIGAFSHALNQSGLNDRVEVIAAFDQNEYANATYERNLGLRPNSRNLDSIKPNQVPAADIWWMSPPCTPFSRRGKQLDTADNRAKAFLNLLSMVPQFKPRLLLVENVEGFADSDGEALLLSTLAEAGYQSTRVRLCPSMFGIPSLRPRVFYIATRTSEFKTGAVSIKPIIQSRTLLQDYLDGSPAPETFLDEEQRNRYERSLDVIESMSDHLAGTICFTSGYGRTMRAGGSFIRMSDGRLRRFSPEEIVRLLGFPKEFSFPEDLSLNARWRLAGNSVDLTCIRHLLSCLFCAL